MTNETEKPEQDLAARDELKGRVVEQTRVLVRLAKTFAPEEEEERQKRFVRLSSVVRRWAHLRCLALLGVGNLAFILRTAGTFAAWQTTTHRLE